MPESHVDFDKIIRGIDALLGTVADFFSPSQLKTLATPENVKNPELQKFLQSSEAAQMIDESGMGKDELAAFMAIASGETGGFSKFTERPSNRSGSRFENYEPDTPAGKVLGNVHPGDGERFRGAGMLQVTGRFNWSKFIGDMGADYRDSDTIRRKFEGSPRFNLKASLNVWKGLVKPHLKDNKGEDLFNSAFQHITGRKPDVNDNDYQNRLKTFKRFRG